MCAVVCVGGCYWYVFFRMDCLYTEVSSVDTEHSEDEKAAAGEIQHNFMYIHVSAF